jgi:hypothetical protein
VLDRRKGFKAAKYPSARIQHCGRDLDLLGFLRAAVDATRIARISKKRGDPMHHSMIVLVAMLLLRYAPERPDVCACAAIAAGQDRAADRGCGV